MSTNVSSNKKKLDDDLNRIGDAQTIRLKLNATNGKKFDENVRLNGTLQEFKEKVAPALGVSKKSAHHLETYLGRYELKPDTKIIRDFTELCEVIAYHCCYIEGLIRE